ncbi:MAG: hypothetical protein CMQ34_02285 [Gammaproteobacteria bacterium]|mgnify:CR=1 FL=1|nr:hypothetical protein [Gammaproteobacteria bacterium]
MKGFITHAGAISLLGALLAACSGSGADDPRPLDNPAVYQNHQGPYRSERVQVILQPTQRTEIKAVMQQDQILMYQWVASAPVYVDFHGHEPDDDSYWYRYREQEQGMSAFGSLVAPVTGEHGWYYRNDSDGEIVIDLRVTGYFDRVRDLGIFAQPES